MEAAQYQRLLDELGALAEDARYASVERVARQALPNADQEQAEDLWHWVHYAFWAMGRHAEARDAAEHCGARVCRVQARFATWDLDGARDLLRGFRGADASDQADADYLRGLLAEFAGKDGRAWFARAASGCPERYWVPAALTEREARALCLGVLRSLPRELRKALGRRPVYVLNVPWRRGLPPDVLGCYSADGIEIYRLNIARFSRSLDEAKEELRSTLWHEIGHAFGMDHRDLGRMGL